MATLGGLSRSASALHGVYYLEERDEEVGEHVDDKLDGECAREEYFEDVEGGGALRSVELGLRDVDQKAAKNEHCNASLHGKAVVKEMSMVFGPEE